MSKKTIGFIGGGLITRIFLEGWNRANALPARIVVMDLIPVKPLAEMEAQVTEMYRTRLPAIYGKIKP